MARTVEAILKANVSGFDASITRSASKMDKLGQSAVAAGAKVDSGLQRGTSAASRLGAAAQGAGAATASGLGRASAASERFARVGAGISKNEQHLNRFARSAGTAGGLIGAGLLYAGKQAADFDGAMSNVAATGAEFATNLGTLRKAAIDAGAATKFSATEAAQAEEELGKAGVSARDVLGGGLKGALDLAAAGQLGVAESAEIAATAMSQFKLQGKDVPHIADLLAAGAGKAQGSVQDMGEALKYVGPVAQGMGVSIEQTVGSLAEFANAGIKGEQGGTALRGVLLSLSAPSKTASDAMKTYGINLYDAQGKFIGVNGAADELKKGLGNLSNAQRDAALGQIFGNAQVTAARVLYNGGAADVNKWTDAVNDSGFAARTAATKMDNLKGDVEQFSGSLQTALINLGKEGQGSLRKLVQGATDVVNAFNTFDDTTRTTIVATAGTVAGFALLTGGLAKAVTVANEAKIAMKAFGISTKTALIGVPLLGVALAAVGAVVSHFSQKASEAYQASEEYGQAISSMTGKINANTVAMNENVRATAAKKLQENGSLDAAQKLGLSLDTITNAALGNRDALAAVNVVMQQNLVGLQASAALGPQEQAAASDRYRAAKTLQGALGDQSKALQESTRKANQLRDAQTSGGAAAKGAAEGQRSLANQQVDLKNSTKELNKQVQDLISNFTVLKDGALSQEQANQGWEESVDAVKRSVHDNGRTLDIHTEKGRTNRGAIVGMITALNDKVTADFKAAYSTSKAKTETGKLADATTVASQTLKTGRARIDDVAHAAHLNAGQIDVMTGKMLKTPKQIATQVKTPGLHDAQTGVDTLKNKINDVHGKNVDVGVNFKTTATKPVAAVGVKIGNKTIHLAADGGEIPKHAEGGRIGGHGGPRQDNIAGIDRRTGTQTSWVSAGEFVVNEKQYRRNKHIVEAINSGAVFDKYANGGAVNRNLTVQTRNSGIPSGFDEIMPAYVRLGAAYGQQVGKALGATLTKAIAAGLDSGSGPIGGGSYASALAWARGENGKPYRFPEVGPRGYDCSGFMSAILNFIQGKAIHQRRFSTGDFVGGPARKIGFTRNKKSPFMIGVMPTGENGGHIGHTAGTLNGVNVESRGGRGVVIGKSARGYHDSYFKYYYGLANGGRVGDPAMDRLDPRGNLYDRKLRKLYDDMRTKGRLFDTGGILHPGMTMAVNNTGKQEYILTNEQFQGLAGGGAVKGYASGGTVDAAAIMRLISAVVNPLVAVAAATKAVASARALLNAENKKVAKPKAALESATKRLTAAQADKAADQAEHLRIQRRVDSLKKAAAATKGVTQADKDYKRAQEQLTRSTRTITADSQHIAKLTAEKTKAQAAYNKVAAASVAASDKLKAAQAALAEQQQAVADTAKAVASSLVSTADTTSTDPLDVLAKKTETAQQLAIFNQRLLALRKAGLNDTDIQGVLGRGAVDGTELADAILKGGSKMVAALNKAQANLDKAANAVGYTSATSTVRRAGGGEIYGPGGPRDDRVRVLASNGEFMVNSAAYAANRGLTRAINNGDGRNISADIVRGFTAIGGYGMRSQSTVANGANLHSTVNIAQLGLSERGVVQKVQSGLRDTITMAGLTVAGV